ncbi:MAG: O-acetyl-ADP-ribose deacetylase [Candidatus Auribacterota bacterium]|nr:O-acetyl-ADP-ribose deacetylase [Candidatus Auribacterota bacterium]
MKFKVRDSTIELVRGDITVQDTDAIVNAANSRLAGGGGVDGAIHRAGGPSIMEETRRKYPGGCPTGSAVISGGGDLKAGYVIHTVGPVYRGGNYREADLLASAYRESLKLASEQGLKSIAFPSISTGAYRYPITAAADIAISTVKKYLREHPEIELVRFVLFSNRDFNVYQVVLEKEIQGSNPKF